MKFYGTTFIINLFIISAFILIVSCNTTGPDNETQYFTAEYNFINTSDSLYAVEVLTGTYFPEEDYTTISMENFQEVNPGDTLTVEIDSVYTGSLVQIGANVFNEWSDGNQYWKTFILERDSVATPSDRIVDFNWPADTMDAEALKGATQLQIEDLLKQ